MNEDIAFSSEEVSARYEHFESRLDTIREKIIGSCDKKCDRGFVEVSTTRIEKPEDVDKSVFVPCDCRKKYMQIERCICSEIPSRFFGKEYLRVEIPADRRRSINSYVEKFEEVQFRNLGILFCPAKAKKWSATTRTQLCIEILMAAMKAKLKVHYLTMDKYLDYIKAGYNKPPIIDPRFLSEIESVDFLCIDELRNITNTNFLKQSIDRLIGIRTNLMPTIISTGLTFVELTELFGEDFMGKISQSCIRTEIG